MMPFALQVSGLEADDIIATMAVRGVNEGLDVEIASPDKVCLLGLPTGLTPVVQLSKHLKVHQAVHKATGRR